MTVLSFRDYVRFAERHLMLAEEQASRSEEVDWLLIPATILTWLAIESFVNNRLDDFSTLPDGVLQLHERAFLLEKRVRIVNSGDRLGQFELEGTDYTRLEDKVFFLLTKFGGHTARKVRKGDSLWQDFQALKDARDALVHPRQDRPFPLTCEGVEKFAQTARDVIQLISEDLWSTKVEF